MLQQPALPQSTQGMQVSFAPPPQATLPQSQRVRPSPPNQGQHGYMPRQRPSQPPTQLNQPMRAGRAVKAHLVDSERAASTYSYQNEKQQAELELKKRASIRERKAVAHLSPEEPTLKGCKQRKVLTLSPTLFSDDVPWAKGDTILFLSSIVPIRTSGLVRFVLLSTQFSVFVRDHVGRKVACLPSHPLEKLVARKKRRGSEAVYEALLLPL
ncbi:hypothetical protein L2E82_52137 [Cichorium intybus]|nr:hypothetical protein L2E82_52137 [Cichorium intybus]